MALSARAIPPDTLLGGYKIQGVLGQGTYGTVYLATKGGERFALKVADLHEAGAARKKGVLPKSPGASLLFHEYNTLVNVLGWHPSLPVVPEGCYSEGSGVRWLAQQALAGGTLGARLGERTGLPLPTVAVLALQLLDVLAHVHAAGYVYCDLNLDNVLLGGAQAARGMNACYAGARTHRGVGGRARLIACGPPPPLHHAGERAYLVDFGLATEYVAHTGGSVGAAPGARGTPLFSSPAHALLLPLSPRDDLLSLAYLLTAAAGGVQALPWAAAASDAAATAGKLAATPQALAARVPPSARAPLEAFLTAVLALDAAAAAASGVDYAALKGVWAPLAPPQGGMGWDAIPNGSGKGGKGRGGAGGGRASPGAAAAAAAQARVGSGAEAGGGGSGPGVRGRSPRGSKGAQGSPRGSAAKRSAVVKVLRSAGAGKK